MQSRSLGSRAHRFTAITPGSEACLVQVAVATRAATAKARAEQFRVACSNGTRTLSRNTGASPGFRTFALFVDLLKAAQKVGFHFVKALLCGVTGCNGFPLYFTKPSQVTALRRRQRVWCIFCHGYSAK